jgi:serine/threonine protein phosphatase PrpC
MGNFLATPITEKDTESGNGNNLEYGLATMQGWRTGMEDAHVAQINPEGLPAGCSLFAVFDGHGGRLAADLASERLTEYLTKTMTADVFPGGKAEGADPAKIGRAMRDAFMALDQNIRDTFVKNYSQDQSGCTAIAAIVTPTHIIVANSGDSRSVMAKDGRTVEMSFDHKPINVRTAVGDSAGKVQS